ncbi:MAG: DegT/DnrJ/EryC1/StrS family aminotransferase [Alphaproteobacteria bacterium]
MASDIRVPQANPRAGYLAAKPEIDAAVAGVLDGGWYILGKEVSAFEAEFAAYIGVAHAVGVANGTDALALALRGLGIGPGDAVATVSHTAVATVAAIEMAGATPVLIDIDAAGYTLDPAELEGALAGRTCGDCPPIRAVIAVHLYGQAADIEAIAGLTRRYGVRLVEDCAQAHGATLDGRRLGGFGDAAAFSLYPTKNLGALGDGGIVATGDAAVAERTAALRQYGWRARYVSDIVGINSRLDEMQAAILRVKLRRLDAENARRRAIAAAYDGVPEGAAFARPWRRPQAEHVFHQYVLRCRDRDGLQARLRDAGIGTNIHYPVPVHLQPAYRGRLATGPGGLSRTEAAASSVLSLPMFPQLADTEVAAVCDALGAAAG